MRRSGQFDVWFLGSADLVETRIRDTTMDDELMFYTTNYDKQKLDLFGFTTTLDTIYSCVYSFF